MHRDAHTAQLADVVLKVEGRIQGIRMQGHSLAARQDMFNAYVMSLYIYVARLVNMSREAAAHCESSPWGCTTLIAWGSRRTYVTCSRSSHRHGQQQVLRCVRTCGFSSRYERRQIYLRSTQNGYGTSVLALKSPARRWSASCWTRARQTWFARDHGSQRGAPCSRTISNDMKEFAKCC